MAQIVDVVLVNDEVFLSKLRMNYLKNVVDFTILVEADLTHSGHPRPFSIASKFRPEEFPNLRIVRLSIPEQVQAARDPWAIEEYSRQWAMAFARREHPDAIILISDIDEFPSVDQVEKLEYSLRSCQAVSLPMAVSYRFVNWMERGSLAFWTKARAFRAEYYSYSLRFDRVRPASGAPGQHFRYLAMGPDSVFKKHRSFAHKEMRASMARTGLITALADDFMLSCIPSVDRRGAGFLTQSPAERLTGPAQFVRNSAEHLFNSKLEKFSTWKRLGASYAITKLYTGDTTGTLEDPRALVTTANSIRGICAQVESFLGIAVIRRVWQRLNCREMPKAKRPLSHFLRGVSRFGDWGLTKRLELDLAPDQHYEVH